MSMTKFSLTHLRAWQFPKRNEFYDIPVLLLSSFAANGRVCDGGEVEGKRTTAVYKHDDPLSLPATDAQIRVDVCAYPLLLLASSSSSSSLLERPPVRALTRMNLRRMKLNTTERRTQ